MRRISGAETRRLIRRAVNYLYRSERISVVLFRKPLETWEPKPVRLLIRNYTYSKMTPGLVDQIFASEPARQRLFKLYLESGAVGYLLYNDETWIGFTWTITLNYRERRRWGADRHFTFVSLPGEWEPPADETAWYGFAAEVNPRYQGKGVFLYLINRSWGWLKRECSDAVIYSAVDADNAPSLKTKLAMGEVPIGRYRSLYLRLLGRHFSNIWCSPLEPYSLDRPSAERGHLDEQSVDLSVEKRTVEKLSEAKLTGEKLSVEKLSVESSPWRSGSRRNEPLRSSPG